MKLICFLSLQLSILRIFKKLGNFIAFGKEDKIHKISKIYLMKTADQRLLSHSSVVDGWGEEGYVVLMLP